MGPTFLVIGAAKAGTTTLCHLLGQHPEVFVASPKELHFFSFDESFASGTAWYESFFEQAGGARHRGEGSTTYSVRKLFPLAAERIAAYGPDLKLIFIARDPVERIESLWLQLRQFFSDSPFHRVGVVGLPPAMQVDVSFNAAIRRQTDCLVDSTNYWRELAPFRERFLDERILVLLFEDLAARPREVLRRCFQFLGVDAGWPLPDGPMHLNPTAGRRLPRSSLWRLWASPRRRRLYTACAELFPQRVRDSLSGLISVPVTERPSWDPETREWALAQLREDSARFLDHYGYPRAVWPRSL